LPNILLEASTGNTITVFAYYNLATTMWQNTPLLTKDATATDIAVIAGISQTASNDFSVKLVAGTINATGTGTTGTFGKGSTSAQTIAVTNDQPGPTHTIGNVKFTASISSTDNPLTQYVTLTKDNMSATADSIKIMGINMSVDNTENLNFASMVIKYEGTVNASSIKSLSIRNSSGTDITIAGGKVANLFTSSGSTCTIVPADFIGGAPSFTKNTTTGWSIYLGLNPTSSITDGSSIKLSIDNGGITTSGASTSQTVTSANSVSNTMYLQKAILNFTTSAETAGDFQPNDTDKSVFQFKATAGTYQDISVKNLRIPIDTPGHTADLTTDLTNYKLYADGQLCTATITQVGAAPGTSLLIALNPAITITKGTIKTFALTADIDSEAVSGKIIKFKTDSSLLYDLSTDFSPLIYSPNLTGSATGNQHKITRYASLTITNSTYAPNSTNLTLNIINNTTANDSDCNGGRIGIFELTAGSQSYVDLTKIKVKYQGTTMNDLPAPIIPAIPPNYNTMVIRISSDILNLDSGNTMEVSNFDAVNQTIEFTAGAAINIPKSSKYYVGVYAQIIPTVTTGHFLKVNIVADNTLQGEVAAPFDATAGALPPENIKYYGNVTSNPIYVDNPDVSVTVRSNELSDVSMDLPYRTPISDEKVMQIDISNSNSSKLEISAFNIDMKMYSSSVALADMAFALKLYEILPGNNTENFIVQTAGPATSVAVAATPLPILNQTFNFAVTPASTIKFEKGQTKRFAVRLAITNGISIFSDADVSPNYFTGAPNYLGLYNLYPTNFYPYINFGINAAGITGTYKTAPFDTLPGIVKGTEYVKIPTDAAKNFIFRSAQ